jgi:ABC-type glycerol-3-phosphate transport system permease component
MKKIILFIFISFIIVIVLFLFYNLFISSCDSEEEIYKLEVKGRLVDKFFFKAPHLKFYDGKDTIEPNGVYKQDLVESIEIGDSLYKPSYNDTCFIYKKSGVVLKVIYNYSTCPCEKRLEIHRRMNLSRQVY